MIVALVFAFFAVLGLLLIVLGFAAKSASVAPSMYRNDASALGLIIAVICGLIAFAAYADAYLKAHP